MRSTAYQLAFSFNYGSLFLEFYLNSSFYPILYHEIFIQPLLNRLPPIFKILRKDVLIVDDNLRKYCRKWMDFFKFI